MCQLSVYDSLIILIMAFLGIMVASNVGILDANLAIQRTAELSLLWEQKNTILVVVFLFPQDHSDNAGLLQF